MDYKDLWVVLFPRCTAGPKLVANTHATTPHIVGATMLGVFSPVCTQSRCPWFSVRTLCHRKVREFYFEKVKLKFYHQGLNIIEDFSLSLWSQVMSSFRYWKRRAVTIKLKIHKKSGIVETMAWDSVYIVHFVFIFSGYYPVYMWNVREFWNLCLWQTCTVVNVRT